MVGASQRHQRVAAAGRDLAPDLSAVGCARRAVLLRAGRENAAARALLEFLRGEEALAVLERFGYGLP